MTKEDFTAAIDAMGRELSDGTVMIHLDNGAVHLTRPHTVMDIGDETVEYEEIHGHPKEDPGSTRPPGLMEVRYEDIRHVWDHHTYAPPEPAK